MSELYKFVTSTSTFGYTPTITSKVFDGLTYYPTLVKRSGLQLTENFAKSPVTFKFDQRHSFAKECLEYIPETPILVTIYKDELPFWHGRVLGAKATKPYIDITCDSYYSKLARGGVTQKATLLCRHILYSEDCGVVQNLWRSEYSATATTSSIPVSGMIEAPGYFDNGIAIMDGQQRRIITHTATHINVSHKFTGILTGTIELYPGCKLTEAACTGFNNLVNGGMFAYMPVKNPFKANGAL